MALKLRSYLAPSLPTLLFETLADYFRSVLHTDVELTFDSSRSGPSPSEREPFTTGEVDLAFICATSYVWLTGYPRSSIELVGAAWQPTDPRSEGRPVYFGDVLVPATSVRDLGALTGKRIAYNDNVSLSGYLILRLALTLAGVQEDGVTFVRSGSHLRSLDLLTAGEADAAAIDSNVWRRRRRDVEGLSEQLMSIAALGPYPVQPLVAKADLSTQLREEIRGALLTAHLNTAVASVLASAEFSGFVPVTDAAYTSLRTELNAGPRIPSSTSDAVRPGNHSCKTTGLTQGQWGGLRPSAS